MTIQSSPWPGAEMSTFFTPSRRCSAALSRSRNAPLDSTTTSTPAEAQSMVAGSEPSKTRTSWPSMENEFSPSVTSAGKRP